jgi:hydrogenase-4 component B
MVLGTALAGRRMVNEWLILGGIALTGASGAPGLLAQRHGRAGERLALALLAAGAASGVAGAGGALLSPTAEPGLVLAWPVPGGAFRVHVDALSAMFLLQIFVLSLLGAIYGLEYWRQVDHPENGRKLRLFYGLVTAAMALLVAARNAMVFLVGWEVMALTAFLIVTTEDDRKEVRNAGYIYLIATRIGTLCMFAMFAALFAFRGSWDISGPLDARSPWGTAIFVLALVGCGLKAGVMPLHVWLPGAHANAPSHVSALMSGVLIKMGIYGLARMTSLFPLPPLWWGATLLGLGTVSGVLGVAFAIGQHDLKRLLAYHSVENIGIICMGLGLALVGRALGRADLVALGMAGALLHVWNHGIFKALLFLAAGSVVHATGTRELDRLGGLLRHMPYTALAFLVGAVAICGLPPLNGFISELLIYVGFLCASTMPLGMVWLAAALSAAALALIGGLAVACFVKAFGSVFLGEARTAVAARAHEAGWAMTAPMALLGAACAAIGLGSPLVASTLDRAAAAWAPDLASKLEPTASLAPLVAVTVLCAALVGSLLAVGGWLVARTRRISSATGTWDCGYALPTARMQYTSSSFAEGVVAMFAWALRPQIHRPAVHGLFPRPAPMATHVPDTVLDGILLPAGRAVGRSLRWFRWLQRGSIHAYLAYILATLVWLLLWQRGS